MFARASAVLGTILVLAAVPARSAEIEGVEFRDRLSVDSAELVLHRVGLLRYRIFFKGYVAALYLGEGVSPDRVLEDVPKRLELEYFWSIRGASFAEAGDEILERNVSAETLEAIRGRVERLNAAYRDVKPGDRYALTYLPGRGTELAHNGDPIVTIEGADFASAYFRIWLGETPIDAPLRDELLGRP